MPNNTRLPNIENLMAFRGDKAAGMAALNLKKEIRRVAKSLSSDALYAIAQHRYPNDAPVQALQNLSAEISESFAALDTLGRKANSMHKAEINRQEPLRRAVTKRLSESVQALNSVERIFLGCESRAREKHKELKLLGVEDPAIWERVAPTPERTVFDAKARALEAEIEVLELFLRTGDESVLPADIQPIPSPAKEQKPRPQKSPMAQLAEKVFRSLAPGSSLTSSSAKEL